MRCLNAGLPPRQLLEDVDLGDGLVKVEVDVLQASQPALLLLHGSGLRCCWCSPFGRRHILASCLADAAETCFRSHCVSSPGKGCSLRLCFGSHCLRGLERGGAVCGFASGATALAARGRGAVCDFASAATA